MAPIQQEAMLLSIHMRRAPWKMARICSRGLRPGTSNKRRYCAGAHALHVVERQRIALWCERGQVVTVPNQQGNRTATCRDRDVPAPPTFGNAVANDGRGRAVAADPRVLQRERHRRGPKARQAKRTAGSSKRAAVSRSDAYASPARHAHSKFG